MSRPHRALSKPALSKPALSKPALPKPALPKPALPKPAQPRRSLLQPAPRTPSRSRPADVAARLAEQTELWRPLVRYDAQRRYYVRLASQPDYEAWLLTWVPGQGTDWHDHGGSAGSFITLQGTLTERQARTAPEQAPQVLPTARVLSAGTLRSFGRQHIHQVANLDLEPAVSLHVYAPALSEMNQYVQHGDRLQLVANQRAGLNW